MKKSIIYLLITLLVSISANANDTLKMVALQREVCNLKTSVSGLQQENKKIRDLYQQQEKKMDSLLFSQKKQAESLNTLANKMSTDLTEVNNIIEDKAISLSDSINSHTRFALAGILFALVLLGAVYALLRKRINSGSSAIDKIKSAQEGLEVAQKAMQEESVKLDNKLVDLLDKQVATQPQSGNNDQPDHSLALKVADEIVRIETNLSRMDESVKGYKQLKKAVERIRTNFLANGYEIVEMLGKPYNEGMKVVANFVSDETLADGEQKITGIIKPQINYNGKMIQSAQITVSQNL